MRSKPIDHQYRVLISYRHLSSNSWTEIHKRGSFKVCKIWKQRNLRRLKI